jgi:hypothetical protein
VGFGIAYDDERGDDHYGRKITHRFFEMRYGIPACRHFHGRMMAARSLRFDRINGILCTKSLEKSMKKDEAPL